MRIYRCLREKESIEKALRIFGRWAGEVEVRGCPLKGREDLAPSLASLRVLSPEGKLNDSPFALEVDFERRRLRECLCGRGAVYEGKGYSLLCRPLVGGDFAEGAVFITPDYIATREGKDPKYHLRYAVFGFPVVISIPGILEAPAKDRSYYVFKALGRNSLSNGLTFQDPRFPRVLAGILLQALAFFKRGHPFCEDPYCSLFNAHRERELLLSQDDSPYVLCPRHASLIGQR